MNSTDPTMVPPGRSTSMFGSPTIGGFGYGIGVSVGILLLITTITLASYFCTRTNQPQSSAVADDNNNNRTTPSTAATGHDIETGLDEATLKTYPKLLYSQLAKTVHKEGEEGLQSSGTAASCCSVCLADYKDADVLRLLPDCKHVFHLKCVDTWLRQHPTCPVCRTSPLPSPLPTPLSEVAPLARQV